MSRPHAVIIEDNTQNVQVLGSLLAKEGVTHTAILDATLVAETLQSIGRVDVVFLDLEMNSLSGYDVLEMIKAEPRFQTVPVVAYTVHVSEINTAYQKGFDSFLAKPIDSEQFSDQLARILRGERVWGQG